MTIGRSITRPYLRQNAFSSDDGRRHSVLASGPETYREGVTPHFQTVQEGVMEHIRAEI
jgi:hypothetical protein